MEEMVVCKVMTSVESQGYIDTSEPQVRFVLFFIAKLRHHVTFSILRRKFLAEHAYDVPHVIGSSICAFVICAVTWSHSVTRRILNEENNMTFCSVCMSQQYDSVCVFALVTLNPAASKISNVSQVDDIQELNCSRWKCKSRNFSNSPKCRLEDYSCLLQHISVQSYPPPK